MWKWQKYFSENYLHIKSPRLRSAMVRNLGDISTKESLCNFCSVVVEDEMHVLLHCSMYNRVGDQLFKHAVYINNAFMSLDDSDKLYFIFPNNDITYKWAKTCSEILTIRRNLTINERFIYVYMHYCGYDIIILKKKKKSFHCFISLFLPYIIIAHPIIICNKVT